MVADDNLRLGEVESGLDASVMIAHLVIFFPLLVILHLINEYSLQCVNYGMHLTMFLWVTHKYPSETDSLC